MVTIGRVWEGGCMHSILGGGHVWKLTTMGLMNPPLLKKIMILVFFLPHDENKTFYSP